MAEFAPQRSATKPTTAAPSQAEPFVSPAAAAPQVLAAALLRLQRQIGNHAVTGLMRRGNLPIRQAAGQRVQRMSKSLIQFNLNNGLSSLPTQVELLDLTLDPAVIGMIEKLTTTFEDKAKTPEARSGRTSKMVDVLNAFCREHVFRWENENFQLELLEGSTEEATLKAYNTRLEKLVKSAKQFFTDPDYWASAFGDEIAKFDGGFVPNLEEIVPLIEQVMKADAVPIAKRIRVECTMGQGVIGSLKHFILYSDQFSSCSPVAMVNLSTGVGGLFHYAANGKGQLAQLQAMAETIKPTWIALDKRPADKGDYEAQTTLFDKMGYGKAVVTLEKSSDHLRLMLSDDLQTPIINKDQGNTGYVNLTRAAALPPPLEPSGLKLFYSEDNYSLSFAK
ncbi:MAG: hypothetical protein SF162_08380 [bacterium]|nr:hypothetical protein [bacterium]